MMHQHQPLQQRLPQTSAARLAGKDTGTSATKPSPGKLHGMRQGKDAASKELTWYQSKTQMRMHLWCPSLNRVSVN